MPGLDPDPADRRRQNEQPMNQPLCPRCGLEPASGTPAPRGQFGSHRWCLLCRNQVALAQKMTRQINRQWADADPEVGRAMDELGEPR